MNLNLLNDNTTRDVLKEIEPLVQKILALESEMKDLKQEDFSRKTKEFYTRLDNGETLDDILPEAFALCREADWRILGKKPYPCQIQAGIVLHKGMLAEMKTGEGKTLTATMPLYLNALDRKGAHLYTSNAYLAKRDSQEMAPVYELLGLRTHLVTDAHKAALTDFTDGITYLDSNQGGFAFLLGVKCDGFGSTMLTPRHLHFALLDEVDSVLIDNSNTPLIINVGADSQAADTDSAQYEVLCFADEFVRGLRVQTLTHDTDADDPDPEDKDACVHLSEHSVFLTSVGYEKLRDTADSFRPHVAKEYPDADEFFDFVQTSVLNALKAHYLFHNGKDYLVRDDRILLLSPTTGRALPTNRLTENLHEALEVKENLSLRDEGITRNMIHLPGFYKMYDKLASMTGTAGVGGYGERELQEVYGLDTVQIPTNRPSQRIDHPVTIYADKKTKLEAVLRTVQEAHAAHRPVLVGVLSVTEGEELSALLTEHGLPHNLLTAKNEAAEAALVAEAGKPGAITVATDMAGRGTDILLGGLRREIVRTMMNDPQEGGTTETLTHTARLYYGGPLISQDFLNAVHLNNDCYRMPPSKTGNRWVIDRYPVPFLYKPEEPCFQNFPVYERAARLNEDALLDAVTQEQGTETFHIAQKYILENTNSCAAEELRDRAFYYAVQSRIMPALANLIAYSYARFCFDHVPSMQAPTKVVENTFSYEILGLPNSDLVHLRDITPPDDWVDLVLDVMKQGIPMRHALASISNPDAVRSRDSAFYHMSGIKRDAEKRARFVQSYEKAKSVSTPEAEKKLDALLERVVKRFDQDLWDFLLIELQNALVFRLDNDGTFSVSIPEENRIKQKSRLCGSPLGNNLKSLLNQIPQISFDEYLTLRQKYLSLKDEADKRYSADHSATLSAGGLLVLGTGLHESRRIDDQLRGRAGRQGDPGESRFFASLEDELFVKYHNETDSKKLQKKTFPLAEDKHFAPMTDCQTRAESMAYENRTAVRVFDESYDVYFIRHRNLQYALTDPAAACELLFDPNLAVIDRFVQMLRDQDDPEQRRKLLTDCGLPADDAAYGKGDIAGVLSARLHAARGRWQDDLRFLQTTQKMPAKSNLYDRPFYSWMEGQTGGAGRSPLDCFHRSVLVPGEKQNYPAFLEDKWAAFREKYPAVQDELTHKINSLVSEYTLSEFRLDLLRRIQNILPDYDVAPLMTFAAAMLRAFPPERPSIRTVGETAVQLTASPLAPLEWLQTTGSALIDTMFDCWLPPKAPQKWDFPALRRALYMLQLAGMTDIGPTPATREKYLVQCHRRFDLLCHALLRVNYRLLKSPCETGLLKPIDTVPRRERTVKLPWQDDTVPAHGEDVQSGTWLLHYLHEELLSCPAWKSALDRGDGKFIPFWRPETIYSVCYHVWEKGPTADACCQKILPPKLPADKQYLFAMFVQFWLNPQEPKLAAAAIASAALYDPYDLTWPGEFARRFCIEHSPLSCICENPNLPAEEATS